MHKCYLLCKYLLRGRVTLGERAFGQILTLNDYPSWSKVIRKYHDKLESIYDLYNPFSTQSIKNGFSPFSGARLLLLLQQILVSVSFLTSMVGGMPLIYTSTVFNSELGMVKKCSESNAMFCPFALDRQTTRPTFALLVPQYWEGNRFEWTYTTGLLIFLIRSYSTSNDILTGAASYLP